MAKSNARYFLPQRNQLDKDEVLTDQMIAAANINTRLQNDTFFTEFGVDSLDPDLYQDQPGKTPRIFLLRDGKATTLTESGVKPGSREFWESAMKGQLFGYKLGGKDPVQIQAWIGTAGLGWDISAPLTPGKEAKFPEEPEKPTLRTAREPPKAPDPVEKPREVPEPGEEPPQPGFFTRLGARLGLKSSKAKIAAYTSWPDRAAAYADYQTKKAAYEEYQEALETYADKMRSYYSLANEDRMIATAQPGKLAAYEKEHQVWEKEVANKETLTRQRESAAKAISDQLGALRDQQTLEAEGQEKKLRGVRFSTLGDRDHPRRGVENMLSMYGPKPYMKEEWVGRGRYHKESFQALTQIDLTGLSVGEGEPRPITDEEFGALSMFATITPENGKALAMDSSPPVVDYEGTVKAFEELGYTEEELGELMANQFVGIVTTDTLRRDDPRNPMTTYLPNYVEPARQRTQKALQEYQKGNKQPLADIISRAVEYTDLTARVSEGLDECTTGLLRMGNHMVDMMDRDPQLKALATQSFERRERSMCGRHKELPGPRTMDELVNNVKAYQKVLDIREKGAEAKDKLLLAQAGQVTLSEQEKKDCLRDVLRREMVCGSYKLQTNMMVKDTLNAMEPVDDAVQKYNTSPTLSMIPRTLEMFIQSRYMEKGPKDGPSVLERVNQPGFIEALDQGMDDLIAAETQKEGMSLDKLGDKLLAEDEAYKGKNLIETVEKQLFPDKAQEGPQKDQPQLGSKQVQQSKGLGG